MPELDDVILGLECCVEHDGHDGLAPDSSRCVKCPYDDYDFCIVPWRMMNDALTLLKEWRKKHERSD